MHQWVKIGSRFERARGEWAAASAGFLYTSPHMVLVEPPSAAPSAAAPSDPALAFAPAANVGTASHRPVVGPAKSKVVGFQSRASGKTCFCHASPLSLR